MIKRKINGEEKLFLEADLVGDGPNSSYGFVLVSAVNSEGVRRFFVPYSEIAQIMNDSSYVCFTAYELLKKDLARQSGYNAFEVELVSDQLTRNLISETKRSERGVAVLSEEQIAESFKGKNKLTLEDEVSFINDPDSGVIIDKINSRKPHENNFIKELDFSHKDYRNKRR